MIAAEQYFNVSDNYQLVRAAVVLQYVNTARSARQHITICTWHCAVWYNIVAHIGGGGGGTTAPSEQPAIPARAARANY